MRKYGRREGSLTLRFSRRIVSFCLCLVLVQSSVLSADNLPTKSRSSIGREVAIARHLQDDEEFSLPLKDLLEHGKKLFMANWTEEEGAGRPNTKGTGTALADPSHPLVGARAFNRISGPDANSCYGCHNQPYGVAGGSGDFVTSVFVLAQRFDFATLDKTDSLPVKGATDEEGKPVNLQNIGACSALVIWRCWRGR